MNLLLTIPFSYRASPISLLFLLYEENIALHQADYIVIRKAEIKDSPCANEFQDQNFTLVTQTTPPWILQSADYFYLKTDPVFILYRVE